MHSDECPVFAEAGSHVAHGGSRESRHPGRPARWAPRSSRPVRQVGYPAAFAAAVGVGVGATVVVGVL
ncbi:hypothetical protein GCM10023094_36580 [Rhodococcus olei]|uniref:Uncharacterized protein n=1 Tax=Rhodococcus olei TaxID=2161675 RepID=A0ABP8PC58_9NOCA